MGFNSGFKGLIRPKRIIISLLQPLLLQIRKRMPYIHLSDKLNEVTAVHAMVTFGGLELY